MTTSSLPAFLLVCLGGVLTGVFTAPMKYLTRWRWENIWLVYAFFAQVIIPCAVIGAMVPHLLSLYGQVPAPRMILVLLLGTFWGIGSITFGIGVDRLGAGLGFALIMGIATLLGTVLPLFLTGPGNLKPLPFVLGLVLLMSGVALSGLAGMRRERAGSAKVGSFAIGLAICIASGILSSLFNIGLVAAKPIQDLATTSGAPQWAAGDAVWPVLLCGCFLSTAVYCGFLFRKNRTGNLYFKSRPEGMVWGFRHGRRMDHRRPRLWGRSHGHGATGSCAWIPGLYGLDAGLRLRRRAPLRRVARSRSNYRPMDERGRHA